MGTSTRFGGPLGGLVPSFADDPAPPTTPAPGSVPGTTPPTGPQDPAPGAPQGPPANVAPAAVPDARGLRSARGHFTKFARSGDTRDLRKSLSKYVQKGTGGSRAAARRMGASRASGARLLGFVRSVDALGAAEALRRFDLATIALRPAAEVFSAILDFICPPGGAIDEAIARQAMLDAIVGLTDAGIENFDEMSAPERAEFFLDFIIRSIEGRVIADMGTRGIAKSATVETMESMQRQLHDFIDGHTRDALSGLVSGPSDLSDHDLLNAVDAIYEAGFDLLGHLERNT